jgi:hypothetical protein
MTNTKVVNLYKEQYDVYIGRAGKGREGPLGNPISIGRTCPLCDEIHKDGGSTLNCYKLYLLDRVNNDAEFKKLIESCEGKTLGCFCKPKPCHGDVIIEYLESRRNE